MEIVNNMEKRIQKDLIEAMKEKNEFAISALRSIKTDIQKEKVTGTTVVIDGVKHFKLKYDENNPFTDNDVIAVIQKLSKQRQESIDIYNQAGKPELAEKEMKEKEVLDRYLPKTLSEDELTKVVEELIEKNGFTTMKDMGNVMKILKETYPNQYDGKLASTIIRNKLS
jgi:uncharacterized protein YqeY